MSTRAFALVSLLAAAVPAMGQGVQIDVISTATTHDRIGNALVGIGLVSRPIQRGPMVFRLGAEYSGSTSTNFRSTCYGLIDPSIPRDCDPKPMQDRGRLFLATGGVELRALTVGPFSIGVFGDVGVGRMSFWTRQDAGTWGRPSSKTMRHALGGATLRLATPWGVSLRASAGQGWLGPVTADLPIPDGPAPLMPGGFRTTRLAVGALWTPRLP